ncbi:MAG: Imm27 family immunity protein [Methylomicrobium sp.]
MRRKPSINEISLVGNWLEKDGSVVEDSVCERIHWLTDFYFEQIAVDGDNWSALYKNPDDRSYWELTYPKSYMHGGGPPTLQRISEVEAYKRYSLGNSQ